MKNALVPILLAIALAPGSALAQNAVLDCQGYAWETDGFPPSTASDVLSMAQVITDLDVRFGIDLNSVEVTLWITDLVSTGQVDIGGGVLSIAYTGGTIEAWVDASPDRDWGIDPPNATVPSTFRNGVLLLGGTLSDFFLFLDTSTGSGAYEANCDFDSGIGLLALNQIGGTLGFTFGGVLTPAASGGNVPQGYDLQTDGLVDVTVIVGVEERSWGAVKELYRR